MSHDAIDFRFSLPFFTPTIRWRCLLPRLMLITARHYSPRPPSLFRRLILLRRADIISLVSSSSCRAYHYFRYFSLDIDLLLIH